MGVGKPKGKGMTIGWRGAKASQTSSQKLSRLNNVPLVLKLKPNGVGWPNIVNGNRIEETSLISNLYFCREW